MIMVRIKEEHNDIPIPEFLRKKHIGPENVLIILNDRFVKKDDYGTTVLKTGDALKYLFIEGGG